MIIADKGFSGEEFDQQMPARAHRSCHSTATSRDATARSAHPSMVRSTVWTCKASATNAAATTTNPLTGK